MIRKAVLALCIAAPLVACSETEQEADATRAAATFYDIVLSERTSGVPDAEMRAKLRPVISPDLDSLLAQAAEAERRHTARTNNEEPPYLQGDIFSSLFEGATGYEISGCDEKSERRTDAHARRIASSRGGAGNSTFPACFVPETAALGASELRVSVRPQPARVGGWRYPGTTDSRRDRSMSVRSR